MGKPEGYRLQGKPRCRWEDNDKTDLKVILWKACIELMRLRVEKTASCYKYDNFLWYDVIFTAVGFPPGGSGR